MSGKTGPSRRRFVAGGMAVAVTAGCANETPESEPVSAPKPRQPNILYITADDLGTRLGCYGHDIDTPNIDRLASQGVLFEECHAQSAICGGSRTAILTGLRPETSGVDQNKDPWRGGRTDTVTLLRHFKDNGYATYGMGKINDSRNGALDDPWTKRVKGRVQGQRQIEKFVNAIKPEPEQPFMACLGFIHPHCPWTDEFRDRYPNPRVLPELGPGRTTSAGYLQGCVPGPWDHFKKRDPVTLTQEQALDLARGYMASITQLDGLVGQTLEMAKARGLLENTIVIFWSGDHGYALGDHDQWGKWVPKQHISRIPLIIRFPDGRHKGKRVKGLMEAIDMYPALLELTGMDSPPQPLDGRSWLPMLDSPDGPGKDYVFCRFGNQSGVSDGRWNYVRNHFMETEALFDRQNDPDEINDIAKDHPEIVTRLAAQLDGLNSVLTFKTLKEKIQENPDLLKRRK